MHSLRKGEMEVRKYVFVGLYTEIYLFFFSQTRQLPWTLAVTACCWGMRFGHHHGNSLKATGCEGSIAMHFYCVSSPLPSFHLNSFVQNCLHLLIQYWLFDDSVSCVLCDRSMEVGGLCMHSIWKESLLLCHRKNSSVFLYDINTGICTQCTVT